MNGSGEAYKFDVYIKNKRMEDINGEGWPIEKEAP